VSDSSSKPHSPIAPPRPASTPAGAPPRLDRVPDGYKPPTQVRPPPAAQAPRPPPAPGGHGLAAREIGADAAIAAGIPHQGTLADASALRLYGLAAATGASGRLTIAPEGRAYALVFKKGAVEHATSTDASDELGRFLLRKGALSPERLVQAESARAAAGGDLVGALISTGLVAPADVASLLAEHGTALVTRALAAEGGTWAWEPGVAPPPSGFPLGPPFGALCAAVRALDLGAVKRRLGDREERSASRVAARVRVEDLRLTPQEARAAVLLDGRSPAEIASAQPADAATVLRLALLLGELDLVGFGALRKAAVAPPRAAPPPPAAAPAPPVAARPAAPAAAPAATPPRPAPPKPAAPPPAAKPTPAPAPKAAPAPPLDVVTLQALSAKLDGCDHFAVLGVKADAPAAQIKAAYFQLAKAYHPDAVQTGAPPEVRKLCADVFAKVSAAWSVLGDDARKAKYVEELRTGGVPDVDVMNILHAENLFQTATQLVKARRYDEARAKLDEALKLNPDEAEFGIWKAWCEFLVAPDKKRQQASSAAAIEGGVRRNPRCVPGYLFLGQMAKLVGDASAAEKHLKRGLAIAPDDADLTRELKYLRK
jgi:hypothetical protein